MKKGWIELNKELFDCLLSLQEGNERNCGRKTSPKTKAKINLTEVRKSRQDLRIFGRPLMSHYVILLETVNDLGSGEHSLVIHIGVVIRTDYDSVGEFPARKHLLSFGAFWRRREFDEDFADAGNVDAFDRTRNLHATNVA